MFSNVSSLKESHKVNLDSTVENNTHFLMKRCAVPQCKGVGAGEEKCLAIFTVYHTAFPGVATLSCFPNFL